MSVPAVFADLLLSAESSYANSAQQVREAVSYRSNFWKRLLKGKSDDDTLQGGKSIKSFVQLDDANNAHFYGIGDEESPTQPQTVTSWETSWRFARVPITWDDEQIALNTAGLGKNARHRELFNLKRQYERAAYIDQWKLWERAAAATPTTDMDSTTTGKTPQSVFGYLITEDGSLPTNITTIQGIDPSAKTKWQNQSLDYTGSAHSFTAPAADEQLMMTLSTMARKVQFDSLPDNDLYSDRKTMPTVIACTLGGFVFIEAVMRASQDSFKWMGQQDPAYPKPTAYGVPFEHYEWLASAEIIDDSGTFHTEDDATGSQIVGPRYWFTNLEDITPVFHTEWYMKKHPVRTPYLQPSRHTIYCDTYYNLVCHQRRTQGCVRPITGDVTGYAGRADG